jgi:hypothetical protein
VVLDRSEKRVTVARDKQVVKRILDSRVAALEHGVAQQHALLENAWIEVLGYQRHNQANASRLHVKTNRK